MSATPPSRDATLWQILLVGGSSGVGKSRVAQELARRTSANVLMADDIRIALQQATTSNLRPDLHVFLKYRRKQWLEVPTIVRDWKVVAGALADPLRAVIAHHLAVPEAGRLIIEGDGVMPALADADGLTQNGRVRAVLVVERDSEDIGRNLEARGWGLSHVDPAAQAAYVRASWQLGQWLAEQARSVGVPLVESRPHATLADRILAQL